MGVIAVDRKLLRRALKCAEDAGYPLALIADLRAALAQPEPRNQCGETCERAKLCATCARELSHE